MGASEKEEGVSYLRQLQTYFDKLGDALLIAAAEYEISCGMTTNPSKLLDEWDGTLRIRIEKHYSGEEPLSVKAQKRIFTRMRKMYDALDEFK